ncbi:MAG: GNAT family N-acetyltransferase [Candidatus Omnitrophica bacterium]|nr:GNAT family N-acetyltransferase [Candidatus Omnitrophota bacterium]
MQKFIADEEVLADALTIYYTDYEPDSCFVAASNGKVVGYIIGTRNVVKADKIFQKKIIFSLIKKAVQRKIFFRKNTLKFFFRVFWSAVKGEFVTPNFSKDYPAMLHINIDEHFRGQQVGSRLIAHYLNFLKINKISGVHFGTISEKAKNFFIKNGFSLLFKGQKSYLNDQLGNPINYYVFGKKINS